MYTETSDCSKSSLKHLLMLMMLVLENHGIIVDMNARDVNLPTYDEFISQFNNYKARMYGSYPVGIDYETDSPPPPRGSNITRHSHENFSHIFVMDTNVEIWLSIKRIVSIDLTKQSVTIIVDEKFVWSDMNFKQDDNFNLTDDQFYDVILDASKIWTPPIYPGNVIDHKTIIDLKQVQVPPSGVDIVYHKVMQYTIPCVVDVQLFPFDQHNCTLVLAQPSGFDYRINMISLLNKMEVGEKEASFDERGHQSVEWNLKTWQNFIRKTSSGVIYNPYDMDEFVFTIILQRHAVFYASVLIFPSLLLNVLSLLVFTLPFDSDRNQYGVTLILAYFVLLASLVDASPNTGNSVPILGIYIALSTAIMVASFLLSLFLSVLEKRYKKKPVPKCLQCCIFLDPRKPSKTKGFSHVNSDPKSKKCILEGDSAHQKEDYDSLPDAKEWHLTGRALNFLGFLIILGAHILALVIILCYIM